MKKLGFNFLLAIIIPLVTSCSRDFYNNDDFNNDEPVEVFKDNALLFTKIFQFSNNGNYLWFDIRNEIANFSQPFLGLDYVLNNIDRYKRIDFRGRLYEYSLENNELTILNYPMDIINAEETTADIVFTLQKKYTTDCNQLPEGESRNECEQTFELILKRVSFKNIDVELVVGTGVTFNGQHVTIKELQQQLYLTN